MSDRSIAHRPGELADAASGEVAVAASAREPRVDGGRLGVYAALGATAGSVPLPWVPGALVRRVRGALVHDVAARRGVSLSSEARETLSAPSDPEARGGVVSRAMRFAGKRMALRALAQIGPLRAIWPVGQALRLYALGALLDRYLAGRPEGSSSRIEHEEALHVRRAIDGAILRILDTHSEGDEEPRLADDSRDPTTAAVDGLLGAVAGLPSQMMRRLEAAFDALLSTEP
jgi:hypothetical protein